MLNIKKYILFAVLFTSLSAQASMLAEYAHNSYTEHELSRSEKKCIDEGYKITYANCTNQTAPADRCPYHDAYYRSCSQEQWCRNNNYTFLEKDCELPTFPTKMCDNKYPMYRVCKEDIAKSCEDAGYTHKSKCQLTDKICPYNSDYGKCCDSCPTFSHEVDKIPEGYIANGETCTTCEGILKTNVIESPCDGYMACQYGPLSPQTPSCLKGNKTLYTACKTSEMTCKENGYMFSACQPSEDEEACPEFTNLKKCKINCYKLALEMFPEADIINENATDPKIDTSKKILRSLFGQISNACISNYRPEITLNINNQNLELYSNLFDREISNVNFVLNFETPAVLSANGSLNNVRIKVTGNTPDCPFKGDKMTVSGTVSLVDVNNICTNIDVAPSSKFITTGSVTGDINLGKEASLGIKGNLLGALKSKAYAEILIKGIVKYNDPANNSIDDESIVFGCNSRSKIIGGIIADTSNVVIKQRAVLDVPYIKMISTSNNPDLYNTLSSIHLHKYTTLVTIYDDTEYPLVDNNDINCDDKYVTHLGSSVDEQNQELSIEPSQRLEDKWQCRTLSRKQMECD